ncbi:MAG: translocation/assembly module TamB domain-containing protein [Pseudomonadales bacterium]|jgi:translocation and assembly module TamB|nr:translocation/assembly module TamB domain-containing protein [Pseudomonadales bacterium]
MKRWLIWSAATALVLLAGLLSVLLVLLGTEFGARQSWKMAQALAARSGVQVAGELSAGTVLDGLRLQNLSVQQTGSDGSALTLQIRQFAFAWQPRRLLLGNLQIDSVSLQGLSGSYRAAPQPASPAPAAPLTRDALQAQLFALPLVITVNALALTNVNFTVDDTQIETDVLQFAAHLDHQALTLSDLAWISQPQSLDGALRLDSTLALDGTLNWRSAVGGLDYAGVLTLGGTLDTLTFNHQLRAPQAITSNGTLNPGLFAEQTLRFTLQSVAQALDLSPWGLRDAHLAGLSLDASGTPEAITLQAALSASYPQVPDTSATLALRWQEGTLLLDALHLRNPELDFAVTGAVTPAPLQGQLNWNLDRLDPGERFPAVKLQDVTGNGTINIFQNAAELLTTFDIAALGGMLNELPLALSGKAVLRDAVPEQLALMARSGDNQLELSGGITDALALRWTLQAPRLAQLWTDLRGELSGAGVVSGTLAAPRVNASLAARNVVLNQAGQTLALAALTLDAGYQGNADYQGNANNQGSANSQGDANSVILALTGLTQNTTTLLNDAKLTLQGTPEQHRLRGDVNSLYGALRLALDGGLSEGNWNGSLGELALRSDYGDWTLRAPVALRVGAQAQQVERLCLDYLTTALCAALSGDASAGMQVNATLTALPLNWLNRTAPGKPAGLQALQDAAAANLPAGLSVAGNVDLTLGIEGLRGATWQNLRIVVQPMDVAVAFDPQALDEAALGEAEQHDIQRFSIDDITLNASNSNDTWNATLGLGVANAAAPDLNGRFDSTLSLAGNGALGGTLNLNFNDLAWVDTLVPTLRDVRGSLDGFANLGGTLTAPAVVAQLRVTDAALRVPALGLDLSGIGLDLQSSADNTLTAHATATSGAGNLLLDATLKQPFVPERTLSARLSGNRFTAVDLPGASAVISPALELRYANAAVNLSGLATVDSARIDLAQWVGQGGDDAVNVSRDVVIVRRDTAADDAKGTAEELALSIAAQLRVGDDVRLSGFGLDARLGGDLRVTQEPGRPLLVYGELNIPEGSYLAYNQRLDTSGGRLLFFGNPTNPVMDVRASRKTTTTEVGLQLSGTVNRMQGRLYSVPALPENEILAILVTGKSSSELGSQDDSALLAAIATFGIDRSQGLTNSIGNKLGLDTMAVNTNGNVNQSSLGLGKHITSRLLMQYDVGIFDRQFTLTLAYRLTDRLKLEVKSGLSQSVHLSYTLEKN